jgi:hypothetical protein
MVVFTRALVERDGLNQLTRHRTQLAIVARRDQATRRYASAFVVYTAPNPGVGGANVLVQRVDGDIAITGHARQRGEHLAFALQSLPGPRPFSFEAEGTLWPGRLELTGAAAGRGQKREPIPLRWDDAHSVA